MPDVKDRKHFQKWAFAQWRDDIGLPDEDRHEFATMFFKRDIESWSELSDAELGVVAYVLRGHHFIEKLREQRGMISRPYGGGVADRSVRDAEHHPGRGVADVEGDRTNPRPGPHSIRNVWGGR